MNSKLLLISLSLVIFLIIEPLNLLFQKKNLDFEKIDASLTLAQFQLEDLIPQGAIGKCLKVVLDEVEEKGTYKGVNLVFKDGDKDYVIKRSSDLAKMTLSSLKDRLGGISEFVAFRIFDLGKIKKLQINSSHFKAYGMNELTTLVKKYELSDSAFDSWLKFKRLVLTYKDKTKEDMFDLILRIADFKPIKTLVEIYLSISFSSNDCERTFSRYNLIKHDGRVHLKVENIQNLLMIGLNGPQLEDFNFLESINKWKLSKNRYFINEGSSSDLDS